MHQFRLIIIHRTHRKIHFEMNQRNADRSREKMIEKGKASGKCIKFELNWRSRANVSLHQRIGLIIKKNLYALNWILSLMNKSRVAVPLEISFSCLCEPFIVCVCFTIHSSKFHWQKNTAIEMQWTYTHKKKWMAPIAIYPLVAELTSNIGHIVMSNAGNGVN